MATAQFTQVVDRAIGDPLTEPIWDDMLKDNLNALAGSHRQLATNGGFEVWQRGAGPFTTAAAYSADRWLLSGIGAGTVTITQETTTVDGSGTSMKVVTTSGSTSTIIFQKVELLSGRGGQFSCSIRINQSVANGISLDLTSPGGTTSRPTSATTGSWVTLSVTLTTTVTDTYAGVTLRFPGAGTFYIDNCMVVAGPAPAPHQPLHPQEDLARCQRYYEAHGGLNVQWPLVGGYAAAGAADRHLSFLFAVPKGGTPTVTKNGTWATVNCGQPTVTGITTQGYGLKVASTAAGETASYPNSNDDTIVGEWNP